MCSSSAPYQSRSPLPLSDPFRQPGQVGTGGDKQRSPDRPLLPCALSHVLVRMGQHQPGLFGEQITAPVRDLPELGERRVDVKWLTAGVAGRMCRRARRL